MAGRGERAVAARVEGQSLSPPARTHHNASWRGEGRGPWRHAWRARRSRVKGREEARHQAWSELLLECPGSSRGKLCSSVTRKSRIKVVTPGAPVLQGRDPGRSVSASDAESRADRLSDSGGCDDPSHDSTNFKLYRGQAGQLLPNQRPGKPAARPARRGAGRAARLCCRRVNHFNTSSPGRTATG